MPSQFRLLHKTLTWFWTARLLRFDHNSSTVHLGLWLYQTHTHTGEPSSCCHTTPCQYEWFIHSQHIPHTTTYEAVSSPFITIYKRRRTLSGWIEESMGWKGDIYMITIIHKIKKHKRNEEEYLSFNSMSLL